MTDSFPFYSSEPERQTPGLYHTHHRCRVAQSVPVEARELGVGEGRSECPFCFLLTQFQVNRAMRGSALTGLTSEVASGQDVAAT